uniref:Reelin domain-containing protein n=1 Tax=Parastrongyloides trichosuri TaxID=131310 RepID=A0A0N4ZEF2_PARTI
MLLLFMMLLPYGYGHDRNLFEEFNGADVRNPPFPFNYSVTTDSDLLIIRCPGFDFKYKDDQVAFVQSVDARKQKIPILGNNDDKTVLKAVYNDKPESKEFEYSCGKLVGATLFTKQHLWNIRITWNTPPRHPFGAVNRNLDIDQMDYPDTCTGMMKISLVKHLDGEVKIEEYKHNETGVFRNEFIYVFNKKMIGTSMSPIVPCGIVQFYFKLPEIRAFNDTAIESMDFGINKIYVIEKDILELKLELVVNSTKHSHFYKRDSVTIISQKLTTKEEFEINKVLKVVNNEISLEYPGIFEASFKCEECEDGSEVKKLFFLKKNESADWEEPAIKFSINEGPLISPHCMILHKTYGFIDKMSFGDDEVSFRELSSTRTKGNFKLWSTYVEYTKKRGINGTLFCVYKIPGSSIRMTQPYYGYSDEDILKVNNTLFYPGDSDYESTKRLIKDAKDKADQNKR